MAVAGGVDSLALIILNAHLPTSWAPQNKFETALTHTGSDLKFLVSHADTAAYVPHRVGQRLERRVD